MRIEATGTGKTIDDAIRAACEKLGRDRDDVEVEVITAPTKKVLGFMGGTNAEVVAFYDDGRPEEAEAEEAPAAAPVIEEPAPEKKAPIPIARSSINPTTDARWRAGTTSNTDAWVFTSKSPRKSPYAAVIAIAAANVPHRPISKIAGAPRRRAHIWKPSRKRGKRDTKRSVTQPPARIAANATRWW